jgi:hypothetical protein
VPVAAIALVFGFAHTPYLFVPPARWPLLRREIRQGRDVRPDLPRESPAEQEAKHARCLAAFARLRESIAGARADALILVGDDQRELFRSLVVPFAIFTGSRLSGWKEPGRVRAATGSAERLEVDNHPALARALVGELGRRDFDVAFFDTPEDGGAPFGHAFVPPLRYLMPQPPVPVVPLLVNCYYPPQPRAARCYRFGRALGEALEGVGDVARVAVGVSGGLWHTPGREDATIDEAFDRRVLDALAAGRGRALADLPDEVLVSGTGEVRNWIVGAGLTGEAPWTVLDYVPLYYSPIGAGFARCVPAAAA